MRRRYSPVAAEETSPALSARDMETARMGSKRRIRACALWISRLNGLKRTFMTGLLVMMHISSTLSFDVHLSASDPGGTVVYNGSHGSGWSYTLDRQTNRPVLPYLELDSSTGVVYLKQNVQCYHDTENPLIYRVISRTRNDPNSSNYTITPYSVFIHGETCALKHPRLDSHRLKEPHYVVLYSNFTRNQCIPSGHHIVSLSNYIPLAFRQCVVVVSLPISLDLHVDIETLEMTTVISRCLKSGEVVVDFNVLFSCESTSVIVPYRLILHSKDSYADTKPKIRSRRAVENNPPTFSKGTYSAHVKEGQSKGMVVTTLTATDPDSDQAGTLTYSMQTIRYNPSQDMFSINPSSGIIKTTQVLDRESFPYHVFLVQATDAGRGAMTASTTLTIRVDDINDNPPIFETSHYTRNISESIQNGQTVLTVQATDKDFGANKEVRYSIINTGSELLPFMINRQLGTITTQAELDRETQDNYRFLVQAVDQGETSTRKTSTATVDIRLLDDNDNAPKFEKPSYRVTVPEDIDVATRPVILDINATDDDIGQNADVRYSMTGNVDEKFHINILTGKISVVKPLDYEKYKEYKLNVRAEDNGSPSRRSFATVIVDVEDVNDNSPKYFRDNYLEYVNENDPSGTPILQVQAHDADSGENARITFRIVDAPKNMPIIVESSTGWIKTNAHLDRERASSYSFKVIAQDHGKRPQSVTATVTIQVRDVNDNRPTFTNKSYEGTVSEAASIGTRVITVTAVDRDAGENARVSYDITRGNAGNVFQIMAQKGEGVITVQGVLDARSQDRYILSITARDSGGKTDTAKVYINVTDTNKHRPAFSKSLYSKRIDEGVDVGTTVLTVTASDKDRGENARLIYTIDHAASVPAFQINSTAGVITTKQVLDYEMLSSHSFTVTASDHGNPSLSDTANVDIFVNDINDNKPEFLATEYEGSVPEDELPTTSVLTISATDGDQGRNAQVMYTFKGGNDGDGHFKIDGGSGIIRVNKELDRESISSYELVAYAIDEGIPSLSTSVKIKVKVTDVNDNPPHFSSGVIEVPVAENTPKRTEISVIRANDPDEGINAVVEYTFAGGADVDSFILKKVKKGNPAIIISNVDFDYESDKKEYELKLKASSGLMFEIATVKIMVQDVNDNPPELKDFTIIFNNYPQHFPSGPIGKVPAWDPDEIDRTRLDYSILGNEAGLLVLNKTSGEITLDARLNSDVPRMGTFEVTVSDGLNQVKKGCTLYVRLVTQEMLLNSVTIRLADLTAQAFLSPLFKFFVDALAVILHVETSQIYVINVEEDVDVDSQVLNVSVSVLQKRISGHGGNRDVFYPPEFIQENIYLQRSILANLSHSQVLPFDDNLCVQEMCYNYEVCQSKLIFGAVANFITSETMLFRPIHPENGYRCVCPVGFTGQNLSITCDTEVDLCYSKPCQNGGQCLPREAGYTCQCTSPFTGQNCEVNQTARFDVRSCPHNLCQPPSHCVPLINGGFRCEGCPLEEDYDKFCRLTKRSFSKGSFLTFPSLKRRNKFTITLEFATQEKNGLLFYNGRFNELHDFLALEIIDGQIKFSFSLGANITTVGPYIEGGVNTGEWVKVKVEYHSRKATVTVGEDCDTLISVLYGKQLGNYTCAARKSVILAKKCDNPTKICHRLFDLTGPLQVGGLPSLPTVFQIQNSNYIGCIKDFYIDHDLLNLNSSSSHVGKGTTAGCPAKQSVCKNKPCQYGGECKDGWNAFSCQCPDRAGGMDCSQGIEAPRKLSGNGYLAYAVTPSNSKVKFPWFNGLAFRTRASDGALMQIKLRNEQEVRIMIENGYITYGYETSKVTFDLRPVNDGEWHYFESRWFQGRLELTLDYGQLKMEFEQPSTINGRLVDRIYVGGLRNGNQPISNGFHGCVKDIRMGNTANPLLSGPTENNVEQGCPSSDVCRGSPCGAGKCVDVWEKFSCKCPAGYVGPTCTEVCSSVNPCQNYSTCRRPGEKHNDYWCECGLRQSGEYCQVLAPKECPSSWYGYPVCGPCNCPVDRGFDSSCNKTSGECLCKRNHYRPEGSDRCFRCDCYPLGTQGATCHPITGQCHCRLGIVGRRCDQCPSVFAEIRDNEPCHVVYDTCPRNFAAGIWWDPVALDDVAVIDCPRDADGDAVRKCTRKDSWEEPDLFNCTNLNFTKLQDQYKQLLLGINTFVAKTTMDSLRNATSTTKPMFGGDIQTAFLILAKLLQYENKQDGLSLTNEQHGTYIQHMLIAFSNVSEPEYGVDWQVVNKKWGGATELLNLFENYTFTLAKNFASMKTPAFDVISDNMVLGVDWIAKNNMTRREIRKYDHIQKKGTFDDDSNIRLPEKLFEPVSITTPKDDSIPKAYVGYILYRTMGHILPARYDPKISVTSGIPVEINSPVLTVVLVDQGHLFNKTLPEPINITLKQLVNNNNRSRPRCVYWKPDVENGGSWSPDGCFLTDQYVENGEDFVVCSCNHLSTFAVLMDVGPEHLYGATVSLEALTYILVVVSLICLIISFFIFMVFKRLQCNWNSIHTNLTFILFVSQLAFLIGISNVNDKLFCKLISITLHYIYIAAFAWLFVDVLHIYRMLTELRIINYGSMKFYYLVGYALPGIIVGLSVGLNTDGYENTRFCWMSVSDMFIWSFAGPVCIGVVANIVTCILAMKASCREKVREPENLNTLRCGLVCAVVLLLLLCVCWTTGLISVNFKSEPLLYVFSISMCLEGVFVILAYVLLSSKVRLQLKRVWYRMQGKKLDIDDNLAGTRSTILSRSALAYRHESSNDGLHRVNIGISTTSTTSRSSKSSGTFHKGDDYLRSTSSSTSGHVPSTALYAPNTGIPPYDFDPSAFHDKGPDSTNPDTGEVTTKPGHDSDSDSELSVDRNSLDLASSHSSDEDDEFDIGPQWETTPPKSKAVAQAREEIEKKKKEKELERIKNNNADGHWPGDGEPGLRLNSPRLSNIQPDVTLPAYERQGRVVTIVPPVRSDSLQNNINGSGLNSSPKQGLRVKVLTHNGSVSSDTESSNETSV